MPIKPIAYTSRSLTGVDRRYLQTEKEGLCIVWRCEKFQLYLLGQESELITDHKPLERIFNPKHKASERWGGGVRLQPFLFKHIRGKSNPTDMLSWMPLQHLIEQTRIRMEEYINQIVNYLLPSAIELDEVREYTRTDPVLQNVI